MALRKRERGAFKASAKACRCITSGFLMKEGASKPPPSRGTLEEVSCKRCERSREKRKRIGEARPRETVYSARHCRDCWENVVVEGLTRRSRPNSAQQCKKRAPQFARYIQTWYNPQSDCTRRSDMCVRSWSKSGSFATAPIVRVAERWKLWIVLSRSGEKASRDHRRNRSEADASHRCWLCSERGSVSEPSVGRWVDRDRANC
jgi:hypothetical protein